MRLFKSKEKLSESESVYLADIEQKIKAYKAKGYRVPTRKMIKTAAQIKGISEECVYLGERRSMPRYSFQRRCIEKWGYYQCRCFYDSGWLFFGRFADVYDR